METPAPTWAPGLRAMWASRRCGAYARTHGGPCRNGAMANGRCRMHGGKSPGAPLGNRNAYLDGRYTAAAVALRRAVRALLTITLAKCRVWQQRKPGWAEAIADLERQRLTVLEMMREVLRSDSDSGPASGPDLTPQKA